MNRELTSLVERLANSPSTLQETDWIEWKCSGFDFGDKATQFRLAKYILGFANRSPSDAANAAGGYSYVIVGAEPGDVSGVLRVMDNSELEPKITKYTGTDGPRWVTDYVKIDGKHVLVIVIDPPQSGDPIHTLRKAFHSNDASKIGRAGSNGVDGDIFVRRNGYTERANSAEISMLVDRANSKTSRPNVDVARLNHDPIVPVEPLKEQVDRFVKSKTGPLYRALADSPFSTLPFGRAEIRSIEARDEASYKNSVDAYSDQLRSWAMQIAQESVIERRICLLEFRITNLSDQTLEDVSFSIDTIPGATMLLGLTDVSLSEADPPPTPPRAWGEPTDWATRTTRGLGPVLFQNQRVLSVRDRRSTHNHDSIFLEKLGDIHPHRSSIAGPMHLFTHHPSESDAIDLHWSVTAKNASGLVSGSVELSLTMEPEVIVNILEKAIEDADEQ